MTTRAVTLQRLLSDLERLACLNTVSAYRSDLTLAAQHLTKPLNQVSLNDLIAFVFVGHVLAATSARCAASVRRFFAWAMQPGLCATNLLRSYRGQPQTRWLPPCARPACGWRTSLRSMLLMGYAHAEGDLPPVQRRIRPFILANT